MLANTHAANQHGAVRKRPHSGFASAIENAVHRRQLGESTHRSRIRSYSLSSLTTATSMSCLIKLELHPGCSRSNGASAERNRRSAIDGLLCTLGGGKKSIRTLHALSTSPLRPPEIWQWWSSASQQIGIDGRFGRRPSRSRSRSFYYSLTIVITSHAMVIRSVFDASPPR
jgi:hypothetical protein